MSYELDTQLDRLQRYRELAADLERRVPGIVPVKGLEVAAHYPAGLTRYMNDLDYVADEPALWRLVDELTGDGWGLDTATFVNIDGRLRVLASLRQPHPDPFTLPYGVEVASFVALGDLAGVPPLVALPPRWRDPAVKNLLMLLFERFEQPYRARDLVDAALLLTAVEDAEALHLEIGRLQLWPEYAELAALLVRAELAAAPAAPHAGTTAVAGSRARRAGRRLAGLRHPAASTARHLQRRLVLGGHSRPERLLWAAAERRLDAGRALRAGLLCFGLQVPGVRPGVETATVGERDGLTFVDTPAGRFLLTAGEDVEEEALDLLATGAAASEAGSDTGGEAGSATSGEAADDTAPSTQPEQAGAPVK